jgi:pyridoxal phosphate enzyme (YggS family)
MSLESTLSKNLDSIHERMRQACERSGRSAGGIGNTVSGMHGDGVALVAVTKTVGAEETDLVIELGATDIGENRVLEATSKFEQMKQTNCRKHFIGHLQRNKARQVVAGFDFIHSVDSLRLGKELHKEAERIGKQLPVLLQVNVAGEEQKHGFEPNAVEAALEVLCGYENLQIEGIMTMAPFVQSAEETRPVFAGLRELRDGLIEKYPGLKHLSMGMTQDFEIAIEEGATMVRVGSALFEGIRE